MDILTYYALILGVFLAAGVVKGVVGMGLPTLSLALLTLTVDLTSAMALMLVPSFVTNVYQAVTGGNVLKTLSRCAPFLLMAALAVWAGAHALVWVDLPLLSALLGISLIAYSAVSLVGRELRLAPSSRWWAGPALGAANGILTGMTGSFVFPGVMYLQSIGLSRNELIQAMGMLFTISTVALGLSLNRFSLIPTDLAVQSIVAVVPAIIGMNFGARIRDRIPEALFRTLFFTALILIGAVLVSNAWFKFA